MNQEENFIKQLGTRLKQARKEKGYKNRDELSAQLGVHLSTYGNYERGKRAPDAVFLKKFCESLQINYIWLFTGKGTISLSDNATGLETKLLAKIIHNVEHHIEFTGAALTDAKKAEVISILYEEALENKAWQEELGIDTKTKRFIKLLAG
jgi:transcriptional regulator with XRE-family HTH domain